MTNIYICQQSWEIIIYFLRYMSNYAIQAMLYNSTRSKYIILIYRKKFTNNKMYSKAPSWSIKGKNRETSLNNNPSAFQYRPENYQFESKLSCKIGTQKRGNNIKQTRPGPGTYNINCSVKSNKLGKFDSEVKLKQLKIETPDPASYKPDITFIKYSSPGIKFKKQCHQQIFEQFPGPGFYKISHKSINKQMHGPSFKKSARFIINKTQGPSPTQYSPSRIGQASVSFTKSSKLTLNISNLNNTSPGPGQYEYTDLFTQARASKRGATMKSRHKLIQSNEVPSPVDYNPQSCNLPSSPKQSFGSRYKQTATCKTPGPADYCFRQNKHNSGYSIGKQRKTSLHCFEKSPGPGSYQQHKPLRNSPQFSIGCSISKTNQNNFPGPSCYNPNKLYIKNRPQSAKIGTSQRNKLSKQVSPGPGAYEHQMIRSRNSKTIFSKAKRLQKKVQYTPGPGNYQSQTIFGNRIQHLR